MTQVDERLAKVGQNLKKFILILIFLIDFSIACAVKFPRWILDVHSVYP